MEVSKHMLYKRLEGRKITKTPPPIKDYIVQLRVDTWVLELQMLFPFFVVFLS